MKQLPDYMLDPPEDEYCDLTEEEREAIERRREAALERKIDEYEDDRRGR